MNDRCSNHVLTNFLSSLRPPHLDPLVRDLVIGTLVACPDALHSYLPLLRNLCLPRPTPGCLAMLHFIRQVDVNIYFCFVNTEGNTTEENSGSALVAVSKGRRAVKLCCNEILQFLTAGAG